VASLFQIIQNSAFATRSAPNQKGTTIMTEQNCTLRGDYSTARLTQRYRFADPNMDLFFLGALGWGPTGGLSVGEAFHIASHIEDGNPDTGHRPSSGKVRCSRHRQSAGPDRA
jgi:hypothetical protein